MASGGTFKFCSMWAIRYASTLVFPLPAPARINTRPCVVSTALRWAELRWEKRWVSKLFRIEISEKQFSYDEIKLERRFCKSIKIVCLDKQIPLLRGETFNSKS